MLNKIEGSNLDLEHNEKIQDRFKIVPKYFYSQSENNENRLYSDIFKIE